MITADLTGKTALVTGGGSGIGLATVERRLACGATVAVNHLPEDGRAKGEVERLRAAGGRVRADGEADVAPPNARRDRISSGANRRGNG